MAQPIFPDPSKLEHLSFLCGEQEGSCEHLIEYNGIRYHLLLDYNYDDCDSIENRYLQKCYDAFENDDIDADEYAYDCLTLFWPFVQEADAEQSRKAVTVEDAIGVMDKKLIKLQVKTVNGCLVASEHDENFKYPQVQPVENTFPSLTLFSSAEVERVSEINSEIFQVRIRGSDYCLKTVYRSNESCFVREIGTLQKTRGHRNIAYLVGVVEAREGYIDGLVMSLISGVCLSQVKSITEAQRIKWKKQISEAVTFLHKWDTVWGDAKPDNIIIDDNGDDAVLIDFGGGFTEGWVDPHLEGTKQGDEQGLNAIMRYIDNLPKCEA